MDGSIIRKVFLVLLGLTYIGLGVFIAISKVIESPWGEVLGIIFGAYGSWRVFRALTKK